MKKFLLSTAVMILTLCGVSYGQMGIGTTTPNTNSMLDVTSTTKGVLLPRVAFASRPTGVNGLFYFQTDNTPGFYYYDGSASLWTKLFTTQGGTFTGKLNTLASSVAGGAGLNLGIGFVPSTPVDGDVWLTSLGLFARYSSTTVGPFGTGNVSSVGLSMPGQFTVTGSPVTSSGTISASWNNQAQNSVLGGPSSGGAGAPAFRALVDADIPDNITASNYLPLAGGTMTGDLTMSNNSEIFTNASIAGGAGFNLPHGVAPTAPANGDLWTTTAGLYARINGSIVGPFGIGNGTVTSVGTGAGLTGGPVTSTGTISMANMAANTLKGNNTAGTAAPTDIALSTNQVLGRIAGNIIGVPIGTAAGTVAAGDHTHANMITGTGAANKVAFWTGTNTLSNNANFHWDNANGRLGIGTTAPVGTFVAKTSQSLSVTLQDWGTDENGLYREGLTVKTPNRGALIHLTTDYTPGGNEIYSEFNFQRSRSSLASVVQNDHIGAVSFSGFMSTAYMSDGFGGYTPVANQYWQVAGINAMVDGVVSPGNSSTPASVPTCLTFHTTVNPADWFYPQIVPERMRITSTGNVGIGTASPDQKFVVFNGSTTGRYTTTGWTHSSDIRLKKNIKDLDNCLENVLQLQGKRFDFKTEASDNSSHIGFIAQEVEKIYPEFVVTGADGYKSVAYGEMVSVLVEAIKDQQKQITSQQQQIDALKNENSQLKAQVTRIDQLEAAVKALNANSSLSRK